MNISEKTTNPLDFFCVLLPVYGEFSPYAEVDYSVHPQIVHRCHCAIDVYPTSSIFEIFPCVLVEKSLGDRLKNANCSGFTLRDAEIVTSDAFRELCDGSRAIPRFLWCEIHGQPGGDDFGLDRRIRLIVSRRVKEIIENAPHEGVTFISGAKAPPDEEIKRFLFEEAEQVAKRIQESRKECGNQ